MNMKLKASIMMHTLTGRLFLRYNQGKVFLYTAALCTLIVRDSFPGLTEEITQFSNEQQSTHLSFGVVEEGRQESVSKRKREQVRAVAVESQLARV